MKLSSTALILALATTWNAAFAAPPVEFIYKGICDASAAATLDAQHFVVASDEKNFLWIYDRAQEASVGSVPVWEHLGIGEKDETDIEGAATIGNRIYWISSHGQDKHGDAAPSRHQFFASEFDARTGQMPTLKLVGKAYKNLLKDLIAEQKKFGKYDFAGAAKLPPKAKGALNIEGLAATADGKLLIGFRNPLPKGKALIIPLNNPKELIEGGANAIANFGEAIELDLGGRGIRSIERVGAAYYIVAGPIDDDAPGAKALGFLLYKWTGAANVRPVPSLPLPKLDDFHPESLIVPAANKLQLLSDDGKRGGTACKDRKKAERSFRSVTISQ